jgi:hypothetical protein
MSPPHRRQGRRQLANDCSTARVGKSSRFHQWERCCNPMWRRLRSVSSSTRIIFARLPQRNHALRLLEQPTGHGPSMRTNRQTSYEKVTLLHPYSSDRTSAPAHVCSHCGLHVYLSLRRNGLPPPRPRRRPCGPSRGSAIRPRRPSRRSLGLMIPPAPTQYPTTYETNTTDLRSLTRGTVPSALPVTTQRLWRAGDSGGSRGCFH